jgi:hypothetical protein
MKNGINEAMTEDQLISRVNECKNLDDIEAIKKLAQEHLEASDDLTKERVMKAIYFIQRSVNVLPTADQF